MSKNQGELENQNLKGLETKAMKGAPERVSRRLGLLEVSVLKLC
jgi:hypothetical protein